MAGAPTRAGNPPQVAGPGEDTGWRSRRPTPRSSSGSGRSAIRPRCSSAATSPSWPVAEETGLQVVPCTGIYTYDHLPPFFVSRNPDQIADMFVADIEEGIQGTDIKAAFIKCAADEPGVNENVEKVHRAAARPTCAPARRSWPTPVRPATPRPRQIEIFEEEGVDLARVQIAHCGDSPDADYIERLMQKGVYVGLDRYGLEMYLPYDQRQATALALLERGYAERLFLSADSCATIDWFPPEVIEQLVAAGAAKDWTIRIVPERVIPDFVRPA